VVGSRGHPLAGLISIFGSPTSDPMFRSLVLGYLVLAVGLVSLTRRRPQLEMASSMGTRRALLYLLVYAASATCFWRVLSPALLGHEHSIWLLALGDVIFITLGMFAWVMTLAEPHTWREYGFHMDGPARVALTLSLGAAAAFLVTQHAYGVIGSGKVRLTADSFLFAFLGSTVGSALPEELLFRGYLQGSVQGRANRWARLMLPAVAFALYRSTRYLPGVDVSFGEWMKYVLGVALPLGMWWGLMRDLAGGSLWPSLASHFVTEFGTALASASPHN
jgi:membrane protease YdiL (CAAX protease family)